MVYYRGHLIGSFHMMSQAIVLPSSGSGRMVGISLMEEMSPPPIVGRGIPPCTQNTLRAQDGGEGGDRGKSHSQMYVCVYMAY